ncbi:methyl-accepting chemotaxis protein [Aliivibrio salmonicida]|uniref:Methyl-accepting chemotaxis protein n=1 Tax=Aliivibrio salmonicida (strain LFI1238) TaxID=316275 RepID=B6ELZ9_ALISL|nr:methyl-accepting chemotaxis protein [Aliivibrio salmonicida]AZL85780.1 methyl-accepting chemotaxis protein [Aliivibrio salmonicida]CAQ80362.1 methyl-accepting chemotaxis protein [Aliivibrio salmonicida LFI1238]
MPVITFKPWERLVTDIKLVPKLVMLMVFSTVLLVSKQLWDANTFYHAVIDVQKESAQSAATANAELINGILNSQSGNQQLVAEAITAQAKAWTTGNYIYAIDRNSGEVFGHKSIQSLSSLTGSIDGGNSVNQLLRNVSSQQAYSLNDNTRYEFAVKVANHNWVVASSLTTKGAEAYYQEYLMQVIWQTIAMIVAFMVILLGASSIMLRQMRYLNSSMKEIAAQNLSLPVEMNCKDEFGDLARELDKTRLQLKSVVENQLSASQELASLTEIMTISMEGTKEAAQEEFAEIDQLATAMSEMNSTVQNVAENARSASIGTEQAKIQAKIGQEFVQGTIIKIQALSGDIAASAEVVNQVEERVISISSVVETIRGISEQTNLLALNAAIEAARAGDAGRGFAVVADEVRNLAQSTQGATVEIQEMITQLQNSANQAVDLMEKSVVEAAEGVELVTNAGTELDSIVNQVNNINEMNFQIASAAEQQSSVAEEMDQNLTNVRELVEASVVVMTELTETSEEMKKNAEDLESKMKMFKI